MKTICICGGGALGLVVASVLSNTQQLTVHMLTAHPQKWSHTIEAVDNEGKIYQGILDKISSNPADVILQSDIVLLCLPGFLIEKTLKQIKPYITKQAIGSVVSSTGFFFRAHEIFDKESSLFGFQRVPFISRVEEYGHRAALLGYKKQLYMACENLPKDFVEQWCTWLHTPISPLQSYLEASLSNSNPLLHPARLYGMWHNWDGNAYPTQELFYANWDQFSSEIYIAMDNEFQQLCKKLNVSVQPVLEYYESSDADSLTHKLNSIEAFKTILSPMTKTEKGWIPDFKSRYFTEDFPFGLQLVKDLAVEQHIETPTMDRVLEWGQGMIDNNVAYN